MTLPLLSLPDPLTTGEGALDPLGLATIGDHLAELILPGLRARMLRPRFLTAMAVSAAVCEGLEEEFAEDGVTPAFLVFEWLVVEAFVRSAQRELTRATPGTMKTRAVVDSKDVMCARTYLKSASIFGFHGVYRPLARHAGIVDEDHHLLDAGYELLKVWQSEQQLDGFLESSVSSGPGRVFRRLLRDAVEEGLKHSHTKRGPGWQGWKLLATHLPPASVRRNEAMLLDRLMRDAEAEPRGEVFRLLANVEDGQDMPEHILADTSLLPHAGDLLRPRLDAIVAFERAAGLIEEAFDWIRVLSSMPSPRPVSAARFATHPRAGKIAGALPGALENASKALAVAPFSTQEVFLELVKAFDQVHTPEDMFEAVLERHTSVQKAKKPDGKRDWFERDTTGSTFVRLPYRLNTEPRTGEWNRPYRLWTVCSFLADLGRHQHVAA